MMYIVTKSFHPLVQRLTFHIITRNFNQTRVASHFPLKIRRTQIRQFEFTASQSRGMSKMTFVEGEIKLSDIDAISEMTLGPGTPLNTCGLKQIRIVLNIFGYGECH